MNGTFVSGARIPAERGLPIEAGMVLMLGDPLTGSRVQVLGRRGRVQWMTPSAAPRAVMRSGWGGPPATTSSSRTRW